MTEDLEALISEGLAAALTALQPNLAFTLAVIRREPDTARADAHISAMIHRLRPTSPLLAAVIEAYWQSLPVPPTPTAKE